jgi:hypothetical protein
VSEAKTTGRPRAYPDPVVFALAVEEYFAEVEGKGKLPTLSGLCLHLGFVDKQSFSNYESYEEPFSLTVKKARLRIEDDRHQRLANPACTGIIFDLKANHGWQDKIVTEMSGPEGGPIQSQGSIKVEGLSESALREIAALRVEEG